RPPCGRGRDRGRLEDSQRAVSEGCPAPAAARAREVHGVTARQVSLIGGCAVETLHARIPKRWVLSTIVSKTPLNIELRISRRTRRDATRSARRLVALTTKETAHGKAAP